MDTFSACACPFAKYFSLLLVRCVLTCSLDLFGMQRTWGEDVATGPFSV